MKDDLRQPAPKSAEHDFYESLAAHQFDDYAGGDDPAESLEVRPLWAIAVVVATVALLVLLVILTR